MSYNHVNTYVNFQLISHLSDIIYKIYTYTHAKVKNKTSDMLLGCSMIIHVSHPSTINPILIM